MAYSENVERMFNEEIREKRKTGNGVFSRRGKGVKHGISGALRTASYFMSTKEKKKLNGEVKVTNMYDTILVGEDFYKQNEATQKTLLIKWRELYSNETIREQMGIGNKTLYDLIEKYNLPKKPRGGAVKRKSKAKVAQIEAPQIAPQEVPQVSPMLITRGLNLEYNGEYDAENISKIFTKLQLLVEGEENKFKVSICITERT